MRSCHRIFLVAVALSVGAALAAQTPPPSKQGPNPQTYGTSAVSYVAVSGAEFLPTSSDIGYQVFGGQLAGTSPCFGNCFRAPLHLPAGAKIVYLELDYVDGSVTSSVSGSLVECDYLGQNCTLHPAAGAGPLDCRVAGGICSGNANAPGAAIETADLTPDGMTVNNFLKSLHLEAGTNVSGLTNMIGGMIVGYVLQVSPDPGFATFTDVPVGHPFHRFVEALYKAGITAGYGDGRFGVSDPITRGQMAVFLSLALGLQWP